MANAQEVIEQNNIATDYVVGAEGPIDTSTAELVLRNTAVAADRLKVHEFSALGKPAVSALMQAAEAAKEIVSLDDIDKVKLPMETDAEHEYRTEVVTPLHRLQLAVSLDEFDTNDPSAVRAVKRAVWLGSTAFEKVVEDPSAIEFPALQNTIRYFGGNTQAAARRAERNKASKN